MSVTPINIISATQTGEYLIRFCFDDQSEQIVNFKPFLTQSNHPDMPIIRTGDVARHET